MVGQPFILCLFWAVQDVGERRLASSHNNKDGMDGPIRYLGFVHFDLILFYELMPRCSTFVDQHSPAHQFVH